METTSNTEATLSLLESTTQNSTKFTVQAEREQLERLKSRLRSLESENSELKRIQPRLVDAKGQDCTAEFTKLVKELQNANRNHDMLEEEHHKLLKKYNELEKSALTQIDEREKIITQVKNQALELEEENNKLREQIQDEKSRFHRLQADQSLQELHLQDQIHDSLIKLHQNSIHKMNAPQINDSFGDLNVNDAEQIATHMYMILDKLDKNSRETEELQTAIFAFLAEHGLNADPQKFAFFSNIYKQTVEKRQREIRAANDNLLRSKLNSVSMGDKEYEACLHQIYQQSITLSTTYPSFIGMAVTQQSAVDMSVAEAEPIEVHNATVESVAAMHLVGRTTNLAEVCIRMFDKLRGTAEFFQTILKTMGVSEDEIGEELMRKIESMKLDLDKSMGEALSIVDEAKLAEKNLRSLIFEQSQASYANFDVTKELETRVCEKCAELNEKCAELDKLYSSVKISFDAELIEKSKLEEKLTELESLNKHLEEEKEQLMSSVKENAFPRKQLVAGIRDELNKIYDTMSFASAHCSSKVVAKKSGKKNNVDPQ